jgi:hypothetical protein
MVGPTVGPAVGVEAVAEGLAGGADGVPEASIEALGPGDPGDTLAGVGEPGADPQPASSAAAVAMESQGRPETVRFTLRLRESARLGWAGAAVRQARRVPE